MPRARDAALITADEAHGISITGEGIIDGNGLSFVEELPKENWGRWRYGRVGGFSQSPPRVVFFAGCSDVTVRTRGEPVGDSPHVISEKLQKYGL